MHNVRNRIGKSFVGGKIQNINLSKINDALLYLDCVFSKLPFIIGLPMRFLRLLKMTKTPF